MTRLDQTLADREREQQEAAARWARSPFNPDRRAEAMRLPVDPDEARYVADLPPLPIWQRALIIACAAAVLWALIWIVARGAWWIWSVTA